MYNCPVPMTDGIENEDLERDLVDIDEWEEPTIPYRPVPREISMNDPWF